MRKLRRFSKQLPALLVWLVISLVFWCWVFTFLTDTKPQNKIALFISVPSCRDTELALEMEKEMPEGIRMVKAHPFSYAMLDSEQIARADLYIVRASEIDLYRDWFADEGLCIRKAGQRSGLDAYIGFIAPEEDWYLFTGENSVHLTDGAARRAAETLLRIAGEESK